MCVNSCSPYYSSYPRAVCACVGVHVRVRVMCMCVRVRVHVHVCVCVYADFSLAQKSVHVACGALKLYFREMVPPLIPFEFYEASLAIHGERYIYLFYIYIY